MESLSGCSSALLTERLSTVSWATRKLSITASAIQSVGVNGRSITQLQGLYTLRNELRTIEARECPNRILKEEVLLGEGETFTVNRCDLAGKLVAVKHLKLGPWATNETKFASRLNALLMELRIMCYTHIKCHPNILSLLGYGWRHDHQAILPYIVVDYSSHGTFRHFLKAKGALDIYRKKRLLLDVACGLDALHTSGIIHGDLKLDNVLIFDRSGDPKAGRVAKICDFSHSLLLSAEDEDLVYRGTYIYNAPEVHKQAVKAIEKSMLPRCDIWAFGLLALEVLVEGDIYRDHLQDDIYFDPTFIYDNPQIYCKELLKTAIRLVSPLKDPFMQLFFQGLFHRTLMLKPQARTAHLCATLPPRHPRLQVPKNEWSFEIFQPDQAKGYSWEQQKQMFHNFELRYQRGKRGTEICVHAAFQLGICYLVGFGVPVDKTLAQDYLTAAQRSRHVVSLLFNPLLQDFTEQGHHQRLYTAAVIRGLAPEGSTSIHLPITFMLEEASITQPNWSTIREQVKQLEERSWIGFISIAKQNDGTRPVDSIQLVHRGFIPKLELMLESWTAPPLSLLECAIIFRDVEVIEILGRSYKREVWPNKRSDTLLVQACRTGDIRVVEALLLAGVRCEEVAPDGCTILHWLFMLGADAVPFAKKHLEEINLRVLLDLPCTRMKSLHKQWPFQVVGTPLAFAIRAGSVDAVTALLQLGANPAAPAFGPSSVIHDVLWTHLHLAAMLHHVDILVLLIAALDYEKDLRLSTSSIASALCYSSKAERIAIHGQFTDVALQRTVATLVDLDRTLLWRGDSITDCSKHAPLATAIEFNDHDVAKALLQRYPHLAATRVHDTKDPSYYTYPAHLAVRIGSRHEAEASVSMLEMISQYSDKSLHTLDSLGNSPLHIAVTEHSTIISQWLLDRDPESTASNTIDRMGRTALHYCISADTAELLLQRGIPVDHADQFGMTSLHCASLAGQTEVIRVLLSWKANIDATDLKLSSPLHYSVASGSPEAVHLLLVHGPNIHIRNGHGESPLHFAARRQRHDLVQALIQCGASTTLQDNHSLTPLRHAVSQETSDPKKLMALCDQEAIYICDEAGNNIIHSCVFFERLDWLDCIKCFYSPEALNSCNRLGHAPLHIAARNLDARIAHYLLDNQANVYLRDSEGKTAFHIALTVLDVSDTEREHFCRLLVSETVTSGKVGDHGQNLWAIAVEWHALDIGNTEVSIGSGIRGSARSNDNFPPLRFQDFDKEVLIYFEKEVLIIPEAPRARVTETIPDPPHFRFRFHSALPEVFNKAIGPGGSHQADPANLHEMNVSYPEKDDALIWASK